MYIASNDCLTTKYELFHKILEESGSGQYVFLDSMCVFKFTLGSVRLNKGQVGPSRVGGLEIGKIHVKVRKKCE